MQHLHKHILTVTLLLVCATLAARAQSTNVFIGSPEQNVLYADLDNPIILQAPGIDQTSLVPQCKSVTVFQRDGIYYVRPQKENAPDWIELIIQQKRKNNSNTTIGTKRFRVLKDKPKQLACIVTPNRIYRNGDRVPVADLTDDNTRIVPKYHECMDYEATDLSMESFTILCNRKSMICHDDTLSAAVKVAVTEALNENSEVSFRIHSPRLGKQTEHNRTIHVLQNSDFVIVK